MIPIFINIVFLLFILLSGGLFIWLPSVLSAGYLDQMKVRTKPSSSLWELPSALGWFFSISAVSFDTEVSLTKPTTRGSDLFLSPNSYSGFSATVRQARGSTHGQRGTALWTYVGILNHWAQG